MKKNFSQQERLLKLLLSYAEKPQKAGELLAESEALDKSPNSAQVHSYVNAVFLTFLRNKSALEKVLEKLSPKPPKKKLKFAILCAFADMLSATGKSPQAADSWVEYVKLSFSKGEANFLNALLRKFQKSYADLKNNAQDAISLSVAYSFPEWLISRYLQHFGKEKCIELLETENASSKVFFRKSPTPEADALYSKNSEFFETSKFPNFFKLKSGNWQKLSHLLDTPHFYAQDPSTSFAPKALAPIPGASYLDLCAAPGGKSRCMADLILAEASSQKRQYSQDELKKTLLVSVDRGTKRVKTLLENMLKVDFLNSCVIDCDIIEEDLAAKLSERGLPATFDGVLLDAPCSNTGVLRRRPDARWRLQESDMEQCAKLQLKLLNFAAKFVRRGGKLVYSTCSIDSEENEENAAKFTKSNPDFKLIGGQTFLPTAESDGAGVFCFLKNSH